MKWGLLTGVVLLLIPSVTLGQPRPAAGPATRPTTAPAWVDVMSAVKPAEHAVRGEWALSAGRLVANTVRPVERAQLVLPASVGDAYELQVVFERAGIGGPFLTLPIGDSHVMLELDAYNPRCSGLSNVDGVKAERNKTRVPGNVAANMRHSLVVRVTTDAGTVNIASTLNGRPFVSWAGKATSLGPPEYFSVPPARRPSLATWNNRVTFYAVQVRYLAPAGGDAVRADALVVAGVVDALKQIPADDRPTPKHGWDEFSLPAANKVLRELEGRQMRLRMPLEAVSMERVPVPNRPDETLAWRLDVRVTPIAVDPVFGLPLQVHASGFQTMGPAQVGGHLADNVTFIVDARTAKAARDWQPGSLVEFAGTLRSVRISGTRNGGACSLGFASPTLLGVVEVPAAK